MCRSTCCPPIGLFAVRSKKQGIPKGKLRLSERPPVFQRIWMSLQSKEAIMRTQIIVTAFLASLIGIGTAQAQEPRDFSLVATQTVQLPGTTYSIVFNSPELQVGEPRDTTKLSAWIASWLSASFGLPPMRRTPYIVYTSENAGYDSQSQTIRLPVAWNGSSPSEMAVFVNAMARHLQKEVGADYRCTPDQFANAVQDRWLSMFGVVAQGMNNREVISNPICTFRQSRVQN